MACVMALDRRVGRFLGVEVKAPKGKLRPEQAVMLSRIAGAGGVGQYAD